MVLFALWSPKGGSGTSVLAAGCTLVASRCSTGGLVRLADLRGDQPAIFGLGAEPPTGLTDWLAVGPAAPTEALDRFAVEVGPGVVLLPTGAAASPLAPLAAAEAGAALAVALRDSAPLCIADCGTAADPATRAVLEVADVSVVVVRGCYLALRRAVHAAPTARAVGVVLVDEPGRSLSARDVADVLSLPVLATVPVRPAIARAVDAGVLATRTPDALARAAETLLERCGLPAGSSSRGRRGEAA